MMSGGVLCGACNAVIRPRRLKLTCSGFCGRTYHLPCTDVPLELYHSVCKYSSFSWTCNACCKKLQVWKARSVNEVLIEKMNSIVQEMEEKFNTFKDDIIQTSAGKYKELVVGQQTMDSTRQIEHLQHEGEDCGLGLSIGEVEESDFKAEQNQEVLIARNDGLNIENVDNSISKTDNIQDQAVLVRKRDTWYMSIEEVKDPISEVEHVQNEWVFVERNDVLSMSIDEAKDSVHRQGVLVTSNDTLCLSIESIKESIPTTGKAKNQSAFIRREDRFCLSIEEVRNFVAKPENVQNKNTLAGKGNAFHLSIQKLKNFISKIGVIKNQEAVVKRNDTWYLSVEEMNDSVPKIENIQTQAVVRRNVDDQCFQNQGALIRRRDVFCLSIEEVEDFVPRVEYIQNHEALIERDDTFHMNIENMRQSVSRTERFQTQDTLIGRKNMLCVNIEETENFVPIVDNIQQQKTLVDGRDILHIENVRASVPNFGNVQGQGHLFEKKDAFYLSAENVTYSVPKIEVVQNRLRFAKEQNVQFFSIEELGESVPKIENVQDQIVLVQKEEEEDLGESVPKIENVQDQIVLIQKEEVLDANIQNVNNAHEENPIKAGQKTQSNVAKTKAEREKERERKIGHRRVGVGGEITYKKIQSTQIMGSIQLGIQHAVGGLASKPERDLLMQDFMTVETTNFPSEGSNHTPAHHFSEFKFKNYAPIAFRYFRDLFGIQPDDFLMSMCNSRLRELSNPGASGSIFYLTSDDEFIIKTVQHKEGEFLQKLLPGYYMNLNQNPRTLLPKFFGLYCYQCNSKNVRLVIMNNLLPSNVAMHQKYDLKGSTYKRKASKAERQKRSPTYKDLDFMEHHPEGILMEADTYSALVKTIQRDCRVLESFKIMDYSLLLAIHNLDQAQREKLEKKSQKNLQVPEDGEAGDMSSAMIQEEREREREDRIGAVALNRSRSINRQRLVAHSTAMESIQAESEPIDEDDDTPPGGIPARNAKGERLLLFIGVIDILQSYRLKKKLEHTWKSMIHDGDTVSVHRPSFYAQRFQKFMSQTVFKKIPSPLKHSPSKRKSLSRPLGRHEELNEHDSVAPSCCSTPPPTYEGLEQEPGVVPLTIGTASSLPARVRIGSHSSHQSHISHHHIAVKSYKEDTVSITDIKLESRSENKSTLSVESGSSGAGHSSHSRGLAWTPPASVEGSTPTWTEGTPSFTESSSSGDMGCPTTPLRQGTLSANKLQQKKTVEHAINCLTTEMTHL